MARFDVVVIGAGLGGLTAGAILAREGRKVLVIERGNSVGGAASSYKSGDLFIEASLHKTSGPDDTRDPKHRALMRAGALDKVEWVPTGSIFEVRGGPLGEPFSLPPGFEAARDALERAFCRRARRHRFDPERDGAHRQRCGCLVARRQIPQSAAEPRSSEGGAARRAATGRCRSRRNSTLRSAATKPSNARWPAISGTITTIRPRCGGSSSLRRRAAICRAADAT